MERIYYANINTELKLKNENNTNLAQLLHVSSNTITNKMYGKTPWNSDEMDIICAHFDESRDYLFKKFKKN